MIKNGYIIGFLLILSGTTFLVLPHEVPPDYLIPYWLASLIIMASGGLFIITFRNMETSLFVCGECNLTFLTELDLRKHYAIKHTKKDSEEKKD